MFSHDDCGFVNSFSTKEKEEYKAELEDYTQKKKENKLLEKPEPGLSDVQKHHIIESAKQLIKEDDGKDPECLMCSPIGDKACLDAMKSFVKQADWDFCKAFLEQHSKQMVALYVGLLPVALSLVTHTVKFGSEKFEEFIGAVRASTVDGPMLPYHPVDHPQMLR